jgi:DnaJ family protein A protein 2
MVQQMQSACPTCRGAGKAIDERDKCGSCRGQKVNKDRKVLEVHVEKGMKHGSKVRFSGEADEVPGTIPGDVIIVIQEKEHERFKRKGADLIVEERLNLSEALCGFVRTITHLDGRVLKIASPAGSVIKEDLVKVINGEGMPFQGNPFTKGRLFIHFKIAFPETLPANTVSVIKSVLERPAEPALTGEEEECHMSNIDLSQFGQSSDGRSHDATDEDDEDGGRQRVQCNQG